jgi:hypothetical protein
MIAPLILETARYGWKRLKIQAFSAFCTAILVKNRRRSARNALFCRGFSRSRLFLSLFHHNAAKVIRTKNPIKRPRPGDSGRGP